MGANTEECALVAKEARAAQGIRHEQDYWLRWKRPEFPYPEDPIYENDPDWWDEIKEPPYTLEEFREQSCGTSACLAGITALKFAPLGTVFDPESQLLHFPDAPSQHIATWAAHTLGLDPEVAHMIFYSSNNRAIHLLEHVAAHPDATFADLRCVWNDIDTEEE